MLGRAGALSDRRREAMEPGYTARIWAWVAIALAAVGGAVFLMM